jgi:hypothetical protein
LVFIDRNKLIERTTLFHFGIAHNTSKKSFIPLAQLAVNLTEDEDKYAREYVPELGKILMDLYDTVTSFNNWGQFYLLFRDVTYDHNRISYHVSREH